MDTIQLSELKVQMKELLAKNRINEVLARLKQAISPSNVDRYDQIILFSSALEEIEEETIQGILSSDTLALRRNAFRARLIAFVNDIRLSDFEVPSESGPSAVSKSKTGAVLYAIPSKMQINQAHECMVRLAFDEKYLLENLLTGVDSHLQSIRRIDNMMEVSLVDPNRDKAFDIWTESSTRQIVERDGFAEWAFFVEPLKEGVHKLFLKVYVVIVVDGEKERIEIVLREEIQVVSHATQAAELGVPMRNTGLMLSFAFPGMAAPMDQPNQSPQQTSIDRSATAPKRPSTSSSTKVVGAVATLLMLAGIAFFVKTRKFESHTDTTVVSVQPEKKVQFAKLAVEPPMEHINVPRYTFTINPQRDTTLYLPSRTSVFVPAYSVVDETGQVPSGKAEIKVREIRKTHEIIASGMPMRVFDSTGTEQWMQTAGMFEVLGYYDGKPAKIAAQKPFTVNLVSDDGGDGFDFWQFDPTAGNWINKGQAPKPRLVANTYDIKPPNAPNGKNPVKNVEQRRKPVKPERQYKIFGFKPTEDNINIGADCPELKGKSKVYFLYAGSNNKKESFDDNGWVFKRSWVKKVIKRSDLGPDIYKMELKDVDTTFVTYVRETDPQALSSTAQNKRDSLTKDFEANVAITQQRQAIVDGQNAFQRSMQINGFGLYNYDVLLKRQDLLTLDADFDFPGLPEMVKKMTTIYLVTGNNRTVVSFPPSQWSQFRFSPSADNKLIAILPGNRLASFDGNAFLDEKADLEKARGKKFVFRMKVQDSPVESLTDLEKSVNKIVSM